MAHQHKATGMKIKLSKRTTTTGYHTASNVARKATAFHFWKAVERRWNRNTVSPVSPVAVVMRLPISWISSMADWFSTATGKKTIQPTAHGYIYSTVYHFAIWWHDVPDAFAYGIMFCLVHRHRTHVKRSPATSVRPTINHNLSSLAMGASSVLCTLYTRVFRHFNAQSTSPHLTFL